MLDRIGHAGRWSDRGDAAVGFYLWDTLTELSVSDTDALGLRP